MASKCYTPEEYLALERSSETKHEYFKGEIFAMGRASPPHVLIVTNLVIELGSQLKKRPCRVFSTDLRVEVDSTGMYTYPDVVVIFGASESDVVLKSLTGTQGRVLGIRWHWYNPHQSIRL